MRVAIFSDTYLPQINGVATSTANLVGILKKHGHEVLLVIPRMEDGKEVIFKDNVLQLPAVVFKKLYGYRMAWLYNGKAMRIIKEFKPDIIHNQLDAGIGIFSRLAAKKLHLPIIYTYHTQYEDYTYYLTHGHFDRVARKVIITYSKYLANTYDGIICPSSKTRDMLRNYKVDSYLSIIPTGLDFSKFDINNEDMNKVKNYRRSLNIDDDTFLFISLGRVAKEKSIDVILKGYQLFTKQYPKLKTKMLVVGDGPARGELELLTNELELNDKVIFIGAVNPNTVPFYYHCAQCFVSASITETQGLTFMESMSSNNICLARYDDNLSTLIEDGKTGFFFTSVESFATKAKEIMDLSENKRKEIIKNAFSALDEYSIEKFYERIMKDYERAIKTRW